MVLDTQSGGRDANVTDNDGPMAATIWAFVAIALAAPAG